MHPSVRSFLSAAVLTATQPLAAQESAECAIYDAVVEAISPDSTRPMVVYDSTSLGTPTFTFHGRTRLRRPKNTTFAMTSATWDSVRALLPEQGPANRPGAAAVPRGAYRRQESPTWNGPWMSNAARRAPLSSRGSD